jgi:Calx-beta domain
VGVFTLSLILLMGFKKITQPQNSSSKKPVDIISHADSFTDLPKISIADVIAVKGDKGQKAIKVLVCLSKPASKTVTIDYSTKDSKAKAGVDYIAAKGSVSFEAGEIAKHINIFILGEVAADADEIVTAFADIEFEVNLNNAIGAIIEKSKAIITLIKNLFMPQGNQSVYEVRLTYKGYTSLGATIENCPIRSNGNVVLTGLLAGYENEGPNDDIDYSGTLQLDIDIDICSAKTEEDPAGGYPVCGMTVKGSGAVKTELKIHFDGRGGYITAENESGQFTKSVAGDCDQEQIGEERTMVPNGTIASVFNGRDLPMLTQRTLRVGQYQEIDGRNVILVEVLRKIR